MPLSIKNNISALRALGTRQAVTSNNIANLDSNEFKRSTAILAEEETGAVSVRVQQIQTSGVMINQPDGTLNELSNVDLGLELTDMKLTKYSYAANVKALQAEGEMEDSVIDLLG